MKKLKPYLPVILLNILLAVTLLAIVFSNHTLADPDGFYHIKISELIVKQGLKVINHLPWFYFTTWNQFPADLNLGYHLMLYPLLLVLNGETAIKILTVLLILLLFNLFAWLLKKEKILWPYLWSTILLFCSPFFFFRLFLFRPFLISIIFSLLALFLIHHKKYWWLFLTTFIYSLCYPGWIQIFIILITYSSVEWWLTKKFDLKYYLYALSALIISLVIRPDFPNILVLTFQQVFGLLYSNLSGSGVSVGTEQSPADWKFIINNFLVFVSYFYAVIFKELLYFKKVELRDKIIINVLFLLATFYAIWTIISLRFIEYFVLFSVLFFVFTFNLYLKNSRLGQFNFNQRWIKSLVALGLIALIYYPLIHQFRAFKIATPLTQYEQSSSWLKNNTTPGTVIFNTAWDAFPPLFYHNDQNYYLVGLDPTFMYLNDPKLYWLWYNISYHSIACDQRQFDKCPENLKLPQVINQTIRTRFNSSYILISEYKIFQPFKKFLQDNPLFFQKKIETIDSSIFEVKKLP